ncbi:hypothetical protein ACFQ7F_39855, partial [Streptomyces sp. NPDC056486]|uniref:hypothetical protein n=1 Tax=Streptomyces sp. NPDC056486 TaxID=3345835 RepID=UPI0036D11715
LPSTDTGETLMQSDEVTVGLVVRDTDAKLVGRVSLVLGEEVILKRPGQQWGATAEVLELATEEQKRALDGESSPDGED